MKWITTLLVCFSFCFSCCTGNVLSKSNKNSMVAVDSLGGAFSAKTDSIIRKKHEMLAISDTMCNFYFSEDWELKENDPHAYWLMNQMMQMVQMISTADDAWAWMLAMNDCVDKYNSYLGRKIGSVKAATLAIEELIDIYCAGNQPEMNTASYVHSILEIYRTIYRYQSLIDFISEEHLKKLYWQEYQAWFDMNNAQNGIMYYYTYASATYSALPMDLNGTFGYWSKKRCEELEIESDIYWHWDWKPFKSDSTTVSQKKFDELLRFIDGRTEEDIIKDATSDWVEKDDEFANERYGGKYDFDRIKEMVQLYETALNQWCEVRENIALSIPKEKQKSYREITKQVHHRLYNDILDLKKIQY